MTSLLYNTGTPSTCSRGNGEPQGLTLLTDKGFNSRSSPTTGAKLTGWLQKCVPWSTRVQHWLAVLSGKAGQEQRVPSLMGHMPMGPKTARGHGSCSQVHQQMRPQNPQAGAQEDASTHIEALEKWGAALRLNRALSRGGGSSRCG